MNDSECEATGDCLNLSALDPDQLVFEDQLAEAFGVVPRTVRRMVMRHELPPPIRMAGRSCWIAGKVVDWIREAAEQKETEARRQRDRIIAMNK